MTESKPPVSARVVRTNRSAASTAAAPPSVPVPPPPDEPPARRNRLEPVRRRPRRQPTPDDFAAARLQMVERQLRGRGIADERVLAAMAAVPRERFVLPEDRAAAYDDTPLAIGYGQTISQPYIVALQLEQLELRGDERLLEVGAGSGYAAAVAARLVREVVATERIGGLAARAARALWRPSAPPTPASSPSTASAACRGRAVRRDPGLRRRRALPRAALPRARRGRADRRAGGRRAGPAAGARAPRTRTVRR